jgi:hypothetical protein
VGLHRPRFRHVGNSWRCTPPWRQILQGEFDKQQSTWQTPEINIYRYQFKLSLVPI